jgi:hypothetical protein
MAFECHLFANVPCDCSGELDKITPRSLFTLPSTLFIWQSQKAALAIQSGQISFRQTCTSFHFLNCKLFILLVQV